MAWYIITRACNQSTVYFCTSCFCNCTFVKMLHIPNCIFPTVPNLHISRRIFLCTQLYVRHNHRQFSKADCPLVNWSIWLRCQLCGAWCIQPEWIDRTFSYCYYCIPPGDYSSLTPPTATLGRSHTPHLDLGFTDGIYMSNLTSSQENEKNYHFRKRRILCIFLYLNIISCFWNFSCLLLCVQNLRAWCVDEAEF